MEDGVLQQGSQRRAGTAGASVRAGVALAGALFSFLATNGSVYPAVAMVDPWVREGATLFGVLVLVALVGIVRYRPRWLHVRLFSGVALASVAGYLLLAGAGLALRSPGLLLAGSLLDSLAEAWLFVLAYLAFAQLEAARRPVVAMGACLAAYLLQPWANVLAPTYAVAANALCFVVLFLCVRSLVAAPLQEAQRSEPPAEMAVANPQSFLPSGHLLFVTIFVFSIAQGLVIALPGPFNEAPALPVAFLPLAVILVVYLARRRMPNADGLFALCALLIIAGMFLQPSDRVVSGGVVSASNTLIEAGASCFNLLLVLLVGSIAGRNRATALPTAALVLALYWSGVLVGAMLGNGAMALFGWTEQALVWTSFASAMVFVTFCFIVLKNVSFAEAIGAIRPPEPLRPPAELAMATRGEERAGTDIRCGEEGSLGRVPKTADLAEGIAVEGISAGGTALEDRCAAVGTDYGLTPREGEVFALLAQGRTVGVIREKLVISLNTARFHTKNIYAKLGVHSQQELIDLVENFEA
ncbi:helix-turn-helix transcriptional regulator [Adlercreutzia shanghongiae]|uniref:LuxR C-terminal-related transcriptional regulator n=1 Tax=Adlercreutzia shanghongiae TaxID=3111773 RepID=A0ABU6J045_9ACTN|nr:LuxR C-terminal-related transcriptional regulator [Adlercreutzia sp. R22]MEC4295119.1 LuxR C-terminal-related transcriptional regulator [Adlercreutzia sp. R22]